MDDVDLVLLSNNTNQSDSSKITIRQAQMSLLQLLQSDARPLSLSTAQMMVEYYRLPWSLSSRRAVTDASVRQWMADIYKTTKNFVE